LTARNPVPPQNLDPDICTAKPQYKQTNRSKSHQNYSKKQKTMYVPVVWESELVRRDWEEWIEEWSRATEKVPNVDAIVLFVCAFFFLCFVLFTFA